MITFWVQKHQPKTESSELFEVGSLDMHGLPLDFISYELTHVAALLCVHHDAYRVIVKMAGTDVLDFSAMSARILLNGRRNTWVVPADA